MDENMLILTMLDAGTITVEEAEMLITTIAQDKSTSELETMDFTIIPGKVTLNEADLFEKR